ncbi:DUF3124 domain-containing protein [Nodosilinea sp. LEGE 07088]|uniref:DUF3124 domain-containing protein n=1 Tax=Nodosilinea sp. LEGE 07088 TaxID=2777968 RepID=UPI001881EBE3|nr:DUF3124 domain-containing protein [Nodosilinea sp. LEGE 07088]MBE9137304.1 DUF3124 domain-containing protein [Nodosilinea sp. LEGE 07088]
MAKLRVLAVSLMVGMLSACALQTPATSPAPVQSAVQRFSDRPGITVLSATPDNPVQGQTVYVPVYSEIFDSEAGRGFQLTVTLSLRNTDRDRPIVIDRLDYYNSGGDRVQSYLDQPIQLGPLASTEIVVDRTNVTGGAGANFIVEWRAATAVSDPVIKAVMISTTSQQGVSFVSPGHVIDELPSP